MVPSAGAMFLTSVYQSQDLARSSGRKTDDAAEGQELGKKPKKVNSEIRKQQNRIASRNYREKRKRKLQYLQQLLKDGESPEQAAHAVEEVDRERMVTPEYHVQTPPPSALTLPSNGGFPNSAATSTDPIDPIFCISTMPYAPHSGRRSQYHATFENTWNTMIHNPPPNVNMSTWNVPTCFPSVDHPPSVSSRHENFHYAPPQHSHHTFEQLPTPPQQSRTPGADLFVLGSYGHCTRAENQQTMGMSNVCMPSSASPSPFPYTRYAGMND